ncbi:hypothetical protein BTJ68_04310 [Hortaea werneckii EXF-2000]|uniref:Large ribosomal subunit protein bL34m n=1 Tax=Hortaea werneckii EXF-2000 TaxID=1157616 RepID=A0A1Z5TH69_HORWE|nr:hypothetical protein BTJ68_04310 [Hortaea werneckii EXF-2000]
MFCLRCMRGAFAPSNPVTSALKQASRATSQRFAQPQQQRPTLPARVPAPVKEDTPTSSLRPLSQPSLPTLQVRGAKRTTFKPSHRVRKRRHGFLARLRTRTGRRVLLRRKLKGRNTLSH